MQEYRQAVQGSPSAGAPAKLGIPSGLHVEHPLTGEAVALWITNYVVSEYGEGALMGFRPMTSVTSISPVRPACLCGLSSRLRVAL